MGLGSINFDASAVDPSTPFEPLPDGQYTVMIVKAEEKKTKKGDGEQLVLEMRVADGKYAKRTLYFRINISNPSPQCVSIGRAELSAVCRAIGLMTPRAPHEFCNRLCKVTVKVAQRSDGKGLTNDITKWEPTGSAVAGLVVDGSSKASQPVQPAATQPAGAAPWVKP